MTLVLKDAPLAESFEPNEDFTKRVKVCDLEYSVFQPVVKNTDISFGDGGRALLNYPVMACPDLKGVSNECLQQITESMSRLAEKRHDIQQNGIVEDIVDPELYPLLLRGPRRKVPKQERGSTVPTKLMESAHRGSYVWLPSRVVQDGEGAYRFASPINNLPRTASNEQLYVHLETLLTNVMPALIECGAAKRADGGYNVAVKLQRYNMPAGMAYTGQWHTEGVTEGVSAAGVVYVDWPGEMSGGALKFRPAELPSEGYRNYAYAAEDRSRRFRRKPTLAVAIGGQTGSSVVFSNSVPHRFETLRNETDRLLTRSFVNFFVTDPTLKTTGEVPTNADIYLALCGRLNYDVVGEILGWLHLTPLSGRAACELRSLAKAEMVANKGRWGIINYGNCGLAEYIAGPYDTQQKYDDTSVQSHYTTDSSAPSLHEC